MSKKLFAFVAAAILSFGMTLSATAIVQEDPIDKGTQELVQVISNLKALGVTEEDILAALEEHEKVGLNNLSTTELMGFFNTTQEAAADLAGQQVTYGTVAAAVVIGGVLYYGIPYLYGKGSELVTYLSKKKVEVNNPPMQQEIPEITDLQRQLDESKLNKTEN